MGATTFKGLDRKWMEKKLISLSVYVDDFYNMGRKKNNLKPIMGHMDETSGSRGTNTSIRSGILGVDGVWMQVKLDDSARKKQLVRILDFSRYYQTVIPWSYDMEGRAKKCVERY